MYFNLTLTLPQGLLDRHSGINYDEHLGVNYAIIRDEGFIILGDN